MKRWPSLPLSLAATLVATATLAATSLAGHQAQASACRVAAARALASGDPTARSEATAREEECLVQANDAVIGTLSRSAGEAVDVPAALQTHRDASASLCGVLAEQDAQVEGSGRPLGHSRCEVERESELARLIDEYAAGGQPPGTVVTGLAPCDDPFKPARSSGKPAWEALVSCAEGQINAKVPSLVPKVADGDPLALLSHPPEQVAMTLHAAITAGNGVCDAIVTAPAPAQKELMVLRCRAAVVANVAKAVSDHLAHARAPLGRGANVGN
jgi:hypothetical protein